MRSSLMCLLLVSCSVFARAQELYDLYTIQEVKIEFAESNWNALLQQAKATTEDYILATSVTVNGERFDSVGVKYKGNSTYSTRNTKNPWHIEFDTYREQEYQGYSDIKLSNVAKDPSFIREVLSYEILRDYMMAPQSNYLEVYVNGNLIGLYSNSEAINKDFVKDRYGSRNNTFVKCNPVAGAGPGTSDYPDLVYLGNDSLEYMAGYELKSDAGWADLIALTAAINDPSADLEAILNVDETLWMLAFNAVLVNLDSYSGGFRQNYYLYQDDYGRFRPMVWDLNESIGGFAQLGTGSLRSTAEMQQLTHALHAGDTDWPLINRLLDNPTYRRMYVAHCKTMLEESFANEAYKTKGEALRTLIDDYVAADPNKLTTYANFTTNFDADVRDGRNTIPGVTTLMDGRADHLLAQAEFLATAPSLSGLALDNTDPVLGDDLGFTVSAPGATQVTLGVRSDRFAPFTTLDMFDDGAHGDGAAGDGTFGASYTVVGLFTEYYVYAENADAGAFLPQRAQHEFYQVLARSANTAAGDLVINEFMASNQTTIADQDGEFDDWIELYNLGASSIDLSGYGLSDDPEELDKWTFPAGTSIGAGEYLLVWADDDEEQVGLHTTYKLSASGESVVLSEPDGTLLDEVTYVDQEGDLSFGRFANGTGDFRQMSPTPRAENVGTVSASEAAAGVRLGVFPNPAHEVLNVTIPTEPSLSSVLSLELYSSTGQLVTSTALGAGAANVSLDVSGLARGLYVVRVGTLAQRVMVE